MANRKQGAGRKGGLQEARELVAVISSLDHAGDSIDVAAIAGRLGITEQEARHRMELILSAGGEGTVVLPLSTGGNSERLTLERGAGNHARKVRLTKSETVAVQAALNQMGIPADAPLRKKIASSLSPTAPNDALVAQAPGTVPVAEAILTCSRAISQFGMLDFTYQGVADNAPRQRHVDPRGLRNTGGAWYLEAYDPSCQGQRVFRLDRMSDVRVAPAEQIGSEPISDLGGRMVRVVFHDKHYLDLLAWPDLRIERDDGPMVYARIPYYGGEWLPRRIAACAGTAYTSDGEVNSLAVTYARRKLNGE